MWSLLTLLPDSSGNEMISAVLARGGKEEEEKKKERSPVDLLEHQLLERINHSQPLAALSFCN